MKLVNINVGIKVANTQEVAAFLKEQNADFVAVQELVRHLEPSVLEEYRSKADLEAGLGGLYPHVFFGPLWTTDAFRAKDEIFRNFGGHIEQGNELLSKFPFLSATNEFYYKSFSYEIDWSNWRNEDHGRAALVAEFEVHGKRLRIINVHGIWTADHRGDDRTVAQCNYIMEAAHRSNVPTIITGDFNLLPDTDSLAVLNSNFKNLITEYNITATRPDFSDDLESGRVVEDYIFVNDGIDVKSFTVPDSSISDHLPMILDFEMKS